MRRAVTVTTFVLVTAVVCSLCQKEGENAPAPFLGISVYSFFRTHPDTFSFKATSTIPCEYIWNFGDGTADVSGDSVLHNFDYGYYYVMLRGKTAAGSTASTVKGVNASPYSRAKITNLKLTRLPATRTDGTSWNSNNEGTDVYGLASNGNNQSFTATIYHATLGDTTDVTLHFSIPLNVEYFDKPLIIKIFKHNMTPIADELIETITLDKNVTELMTNNPPYSQLLNFKTSTSEGSLTFYWQ
ncbi:MAG: hypothetical protein JSS90_09830 [Bacteroidetes bacterium]|jgi:hypothetical protein|nr:hypothetical protein [Bacteroidota bacterium]